MGPSQRGPLGVRDPQNRRWTFNYTLRSRTILVLLSVCVAANACGLIGRGGGRSRDGAPRDLTLVATNQNFYDATLYAISPGNVRQRLGIVPGHSEETFVFRWSNLELRIEIDLLSVGSTLTDRLPVDEGDELELIITPDLHMRIP